MSAPDLTNLAESDYIEFHEMIAERKQLLACIAELEAEQSLHDAELDAGTARTEQAEAELAGLLGLAQAVCWFDFSLDDHDAFMAVERLRATLDALKAERGKS